MYNVNTDENGNDKIYDRLKEDLKISPIILFDEKGIKEVTPNDIMEKVNEYSKNRGVSDEVQEIPIDLNLIKDSLIYKEKVECCKKYLSTKFARIICLMTPYSFLYYLPNFNDIYNDIDWSKSIEDIDKQLYKKYKLTKEEIEFIEKNIKPMK